MRTAADAAARVTRLLAGQLPRSAVHELVLRLDDPRLEESLDRSVMVKPTGGLSVALKMLANEFKDLGISDKERPYQCRLQEKLGPKAAEDTG